MMWEGKKPAFIMFYQEQNLRVSMRASFCMVTLNLFIIFSRVLQY